MALDDAFLIELVRRGSDDAVVDQCLRRSPG
jgi:hypothetical protein